MAGGANESPRQRMINMMYLVLTALLALQVSNAVLEKFVLLDKTLKHSVLLVREENEDRINAIEQQVKERGNKESDEAVLEKVHYVHNLTNEVITYLEQVKAEIETAAGGRDPETNKLKKPADYTDQMAYTLGTPGKEGEAYVLEKKLDDYAEKMDEVLSTMKLDSASASQRIKIESIPKMIAKEVSEVLDREDSNKDFAHLFFENTPTVAVFALITQLEAEVARAESDVLVELGKQVGAEDLRFDKIEAVVSPESKIVAAGTKYKAKMFLVASSSTAKPKMTLNGRNIKVTEGKGEIEILAGGGKYDKEGNIMRSWKGSITIKGPFGDTTFVINEKYIVTKPVIQIQSASVSALYLNCGNELNVQVPALGSYYNPSFNAKGAEVIKSSKKGFITVVPNRGKVVLSVNNAGSKIGDENFNVRAVPRPEIKLYSRGKLVDLKNGVQASSLRELEIRAISDEHFKEFLPKDARYRVTEWELILARGKRAISVQKNKAPTSNISSLIAKAKGGSDRLVIEVKEVVRKNFKDRVEKVKVGLQIFTIPLN